MAFGGRPAAGFGARPGGSSRDLLPESTPTPAPHSARATRWQGRPARGTGRPTRTASARDGQRSSRGPPIVAAVIRRPLQCSAECTPCEGEQGRCRSSLLRGVIPEWRSQHRPCRSTSRTRTPLRLRDRSLWLLEGDEWGRLPFPESTGCGLQPHLLAHRALDIQARSPEGTGRRPAGGVRRWGHRGRQPAPGDSGVEITTPLQTEPWGERFLQVTDPNGIVIQLVQWVTSPSDQPA